MSVNYNMNQLFISTKNIMEKTVKQKAAAYELIEMKINVLKKVYTEAIEEKKSEIKKSKEVGHADYVIMVEEGLLKEYNAKLSMLNDLI